MQKLLIATTNQGKIREFRALLAELDVELVTPQDVGLELEVVEDGQTYAENAGKKARPVLCSSPRLQGLKARQMPAHGHRTASGVVGAIIFSERA